MRNRKQLFSLLLEIFLLSLCYAKVLDDTCRAKREVFLRDMSELKNEKSNDDVKADDSISLDVQPLNAKNPYNKVLQRVQRNLNNDARRYTDQDESSSLYDDYDARDIAKRGAEDYEEMEEEDDSPMALEDTVAMRDDTRNKETDLRTKRDEVSEKWRKHLPEERITSNEENPGIFVEDLSKATRSEIKNSKIDEPMNIVVSSAKRDSSEMKYDDSVVEEIQRKIDSIKEEIQRDIVRQQQIRDIEENNAKFDQLRDQEQEHEEGDRFVRESIEERRNTAKRSIGKIVDKKNGKEKVSDIKQIAARNIVKKKGDRVKHAILVNNGRSSEQFHASLPIISDDRNKGKRENSAKMIGGRRENHLMPLVASSRELSPRLAKEYKEAFGGLQNEAGSALARFKRIKRVLNVAHSNKLDKT